MLLVLPLVVLLLLWVLLLSVLELVMELMRLPASFLVIVSAVIINRLDPTPSHLQQNRRGPSFLSFGLGFKCHDGHNTDADGGAPAFSLQWL